MMMQPMKPAPICSTRAPGLASAMILRASASVQQGCTPGQVDAWDRRRDRARAGGDEQAVEGKRRAVLERDAARVAVHRFCPARAQLDALRGEMVLALAQVGAVLVDVARSADRESPCANTAAPVRPRRGDLVPRRVLADGLGRDHAGGPVAQDHVLHVRPPTSRKGRFPRNRPMFNSSTRRTAPLHSPRRARVSGFSRPSVSQPRSLVVFGQHLVQAVDQAFGRAGLRRLGQQPLGQGVVLVR